ncbi:MAG: hypothetical protein QOG77_2916 [Solirubrobacteraceae bacterium]|nr:hypothetical protein [Solirubrobacteraceae bacterium]
MPQTGQTTDPPATRDGDAQPRPRRFSEGLERRPTAPADSRVGRFSDGLSRARGAASVTRIGTFATGQAESDASGRGPVGTFADGLAAPGPDPNPAPPPSRTTARSKP